MVDKIGWTEPLDSERGALEIVTVAACRSALLGALVDVCQKRMGDPTGVRGFAAGRNNDDRWPFEDQRNSSGRARPWRGGKPAHGRDAGRVNQGVHGGGRGGARALGALIGPITIMRPALQCGHWWISKEATRSQNASTDSG